MLFEPPRSKSSKKPYFCAMKFMTLALRLLFLGGILLSLTTCKNEPKAPPTLPQETGSNFPQIDALTQRIADNPKDAQLYFNRAKSYAQLEGYDEAIADLAKAMSIDSTNLEYHHLLADVYLQYSQSFRAILTLQRATGLHPEDIPTKIKLCRFHIILTQYPEALKVVQEILEKDPQSAEAYFLMGLIFQEEGKTDNAINAFQTAVENEPDLIDGWVILGQLFQSKDDPRALQYFDNAVRLDSTNIAAHHTRANYLQQTGQLEKAIAAYRKISIMNPSYSDAYFNTGLAYLELDSVQLAYQHFDLVVKTDPTNALGYYYRGLSAQLKGQIENAKKDFQQALSFDADLQDARRALDALEQE